MALAATDVHIKPGECDPLECVICFAQLSCARELPCACTAAYCTQCWDRSLAQSIQSCGKVLCPTCRMPLRVDFDADQCCLVFSAIPAEERAEPIGRRYENLVRYQDRLAVQARPVQLRLLRECGAALPSHLRRPALHGDSELSDVAELSARCAALEAAPRCVCGMTIRRVSGRERASRFFRMHNPDIPHDSAECERFLEQADQLNLAYCDICNASVPPNTPVWICQQENRTILHANAFDICDACFVQYACGVEEGDHEESDANNWDGAAVIAETESTDPANL